MTLMRLEVVSTDLFLLVMPFPCTWLMLNNLTGMDASL